MPFLELRKELAALILSQLPNAAFSTPDIEKEFSIPPNIQLGHIAWPCFRAAKSLGVAPGKLAQEIAAKISSPDVKATATGPYINFRWKSETLYKKTLARILQEQGSYGCDESGKGKTVLLEYCSPNIAKPLFFHHIRSTLIGSTLANMYKALGFQIERINFVGDWGAQFARLVAAFEMWGDKSLLQAAHSPEANKKAMAHLLEIYVRFHQELENHPEYTEKANACLQKLETKHPETTQLWEKVRTISLTAMDQTLSRLSVFFDHTEGESHYVADAVKTMEDVKVRAQAKLSEGAWIVELPDVATPALIQKRDGTTLYLTRDIAAAEDRYRRFQFHKSFYVVSEQQRLHFQQLFGTLKKMGLSWADHCEHLSFGTVLFNSERMSTREGRAIYLDDVLNESEKLALQECTEKNPGLNDKETVARMVGIGAVIFGQLSTHKQRDINFDWKQVLAFDGETGPYVQYSHVRCRSLLEKAKEKNEKYGVNSETSQYVFSGEEDQLVLTLSQLRSVLHQVIQDNEPCHLTRYLVDVAKAYNRFYYQLPVLQATDPLQKEVRLNLVLATQTVLKNGLTLLGIPCPQEM